MRRRRLNIKRVLILLFVISIVGFGIYYAFNNMKKDNAEPKVLKNIVGYNYSLTNNKTTLYKKYFKELKVTLENKPLDEKIYASTVVKLLIADFYDLNSKSSKNDVGGTQFIYPDTVDNFKLNAQNTLYKYIESNIGRKRDQELPSVKSVVIKSIVSSATKIGKTNYTGYKIKATWTYKKDLGYETKSDFELVKKDKYYYIIKMD